MLEQARIRRRQAHRPAAARSCPVVRSSGRVQAASKKALHTSGDLAGHHSPMPSGHSPSPFPFFPIPSPSSGRFLRRDGFRAACTNAIDTRHACAAYIYEGCAAIITMLTHRAHSHTFFELCGMPHPHMLLTCSAQPAAAALLPHIRHMPSPHHRNTREGRQTNANPTKTRQHDGSAGSPPAHCHN
eukprot:scaffold16485_cov140-Isochrysis_galbana.AAC.5